MSKRVIKHLKDNMDNFAVKCINKQINFGNENDQNIIDFKKSITLICDTFNIENDLKDQLEFKINFFIQAMNNLAKFLSDDDLIVSVLSAIKEWEDYIDRYYDKEHIEIRAKLRQLSKSKVSF